MMHARTFLGLFLSGALSVSWAGVNAAAGLYVDLDCGSPEIDSAASRLFSGPNAEPFWVGVRISNAKYLDSYEFKLAFDPSKLAFVRAVAAIPDEGYENFLETKGGSAPFFIGKLSMRDSSRATIGNSLSGSDSSRSPDGSGLLAFLQFRPLAAGTARFALEEAQLLDWEQNPDTPAAMRGAALALESPVFARSVVRGSPFVKWAGGSLELDLGVRTASLRISDARGRELFRRDGLRGRQTLGWPGMAAAGNLIILQTAEGSIRLPAPAGG